MNPERDRVEGQRVARGLVRGAAFSLAIVAGLCAGVGTALLTLGAGL